MPISKPRFTKWYEQNFDKETAVRFLEEVETYSHRYILYNEPNMRDKWPLSEPLYDPELDPKAIIVHHSKCPTITESLTLIARGVYDSHFLITGAKHYSPRKDKFPLLSEVEGSTILMLRALDKSVAHSGYISQKSIGIELRNCGILRPVEKDYPAEPIEPIDETPEKFEWRRSSKPNLYTMFNTWRKQFAGTAVRYRNNYFEKPNKSQIISLIVLLKALFRYYDREIPMNMILPSNCVTGEDTFSPIIDWKFIRSLIKDRPDAKISTEKYLTHFLRDNKSDFETEHYAMDEGEISHHLNYMRWRGESDPGKLHILMNEFEYYQVAHRYENQLAFLGYDTTDHQACSESMFMYAVAHGLERSTPQEVYNDFEERFIRVA
jgi:hypothetical protein